jgi:hypothetical protein
VAEFAASQASLAVAQVPRYKLGTEGGSVVESSVAVYAEKDLLAAPRVQVVLHHEIQELPVAVPDLIYKLREGDTARDQTLASLA